MEVAKYEYATCYPQLSEDLQSLCSEKLSQAADSIKGWLTVHSINAKGLAIKDRMIGTQKHTKTYALVLVVCLRRALLYSEKTSFNCLIENRQ